MTDLLHAIFKTYGESEIIAANPNHSLASFLPKYIEVILHVKVTRGWLTGKAGVALELSKHAGVGVCGVEMQSGKPHLLSLNSLLPNTLWW